MTLEGLAGAGSPSVLDSADRPVAHAYEEICSRLRAAVDYLLTLDPCNDAANLGRGLLCPRPASDARLFAAAYARSHGLEADALCAHALPVENWTLPFNQGLAMTLMTYANRAAHAFWKSAEAQQELDAFFLQVSQLTRKDYSK